MLSLNFIQTIPEQDKIKKYLLGDKTFERLKCNHPQLTMSIMKEFSIIHEYLQFITNQNIEKNYNFMFMIYLIVSLFIVTIIPHPQERENHNKKNNLQKNYNKVSQFTTLFIQIQQNLIIVKYVTIRQANESIDIDEQIQQNNTQLKFLPDIKKIYLQCLVTTLQLSKILNPSREEISTPKKQNNLLSVMIKWHPIMKFSRCLKIFNQKQSIILCLFNIKQYFIVYHFQLLLPPFVSMIQRRKIIISKKVKTRFLKSPHGSFRSNKAQQQQNKLQKEKSMK
ncbi:hypothetical protein pb186bvf_001243 [Paramecium bursaria]